LSYVLDAGVWIRGLLGADKDCLEVLRLVLRKKVRVVVNSYCVAEVTRALKRISYRLSLDSRSLERDLWIILNSDFVVQEFDRPVSEGLLRELRRAPEILLISKLLELEPKDVPYLVIAFKTGSKIVSTDERSLISKRREIEEKIGVKILRISEFLEELEAPYPKQ